jgi:hypothetical protein
MHLPSTRQLTDPPVSIRRGPPWDSANEAEVAVLAKESRDVS